MRVHFYKTGRYDLSGNILDLGVRSVDVRRDGGDPAVFDQDVPDIIDAVGGIDDTSAFQQYFQ